MGKLPRSRDDEANALPIGEVSGLLRAWSDGDRAALDRLTPIVYDELHRLARRYMRGERPGHSLQSDVPWSMKPTCAWWITRA